MQRQQHFRVQLKRSGAGRNSSHRATLAGLGLTRMGKEVFCKDTPAVRGMLYKVNFLISIEVRDGLPPPSTRQRAQALAAKAN